MMCRHQENTGISVEKEIQKYINVRGGQQVPRAQQTFHASDGLGRGFVRPSAIIRSLVEAHSTLKSPRSTRSRSQCCWISTWRSLVVIIGAILLTKPTVWLLSQ